MALNEACLARDIAKVEAEKAEVELERIKAEVIKIKTGYECQKGHLSKNDDNSEEFFDASDSDILSEGVNDVDMSESAVYDENIDDESDVDAEKPQPHDVDGGQ